MDNSKMIAGRFLRLQKKRNRLAFITAQLNAGNTVYVHTAIGATKYTKKHIEYFTLGKDGSVNVQHGKRKLCIDINHISAYGPNGQCTGCFPIF